MSMGFSGREVLKKSDVTHQHSMNEVSEHSTFPKILIFGSWLFIMVDTAVLLIKQIQTLFISWYYDIPTHCSNTEIYFINSL